MCSRLTCTAAEAILFVVNMAAATAPVGQTSSPKSRLPDTFTPEANPAARNPRGAVTL